MSQHSTRAVAYENNPNRQEAGSGMSKPTTWSGWAAKLRGPFPEQLRTHWESQRQGLVQLIVKTYLPDRVGEDISYPEIMRAVKLAAGAGNADAFAIVSSGFLEVRPLVRQSGFPSAR